MVDENSGYCNIIPARDPKQCEGSRRIKHFNVDGDAVDDDGHVDEDGEDIFFAEGKTRQANDDEDEDDDDDAEDDDDDCDFDDDDDDDDDDYDDDDDDDDGDDGDDDEEEDDDGDNNSERFDEFKINK